MSTLTRYLTLFSYLVISLLMLATPSYSESPISEKSLASDIVIEDAYQPGSGLPVGKIQSLRGQALVFHRDPTVGYPIHIGLPLYNGDILLTRSQAWLLCRLIDGTSIALAPETTLTILQSSYNSARKTSVSSLYLKNGGARFKLQPLPDLDTNEVKVQTELAFSSATEADFLIRTNPAASNIVAFEKSRLEITSMAQPEAVTFLSDFQRVIISIETISPAVETLTRQEVETIMANFQPGPQSIFWAGGNYAAPDTPEKPLPSE